LRVLFILLIALLSVSSLANKDTEETVVNFFTLSAEQALFDNQKVTIRGWIKFYEFPQRKEVLLFHSVAAMNEYRKDEAIEVVLPAADFKKSMQYLNNQNVAVYAVYKASRASGLFGKLDRVKDIDIINARKKEN